MSLFRVGGKAVLSLKSELNSSFTSASSAHWRSVFRKNLEREIENYMTIAVM